MKKRYVVSIEIIMEDDEKQSSFGDLDLGCLNQNQKDGIIEQWDYRDIESVHNVNEDGTVDYGEKE